MYPFENTKLLTKLYKTYLDFHDFLLGGLSQNAQREYLHGEGDAAQEKKHEGDAIQHVFVCEVPERPN